jgi:hypothetical protein
MNRRIWIIVFLSLFFLFRSSSFASDIEFLIVDKTRTPWGHKFYRTFQEIWQPPVGIEEYFITIGEEKVSTRQSWIYVKIGDNIFNYKVFETLLKPTMGDFDMQRLALKAARKSLNFLLKKYIIIKRYENEL